MSACNSPKSHEHTDRDKNNWYKEQFEVRGTDVAQSDPPPSPSVWWPAPPALITEMVRPYLNN